MAPHPLPLHRRALRYVRANAVAFLALFVALGGTGAYAANTIGSADIIDGEVKSADIGVGQVLGSRITDETVKSVDIANNQVTGADVSEGSLAKVPGADTLDGQDSTAFAPLSAQTFANRFGAGGLATMGGGTGGTDCYLGQITLTAATTTLPKGYMSAHGQQLPISENESLFSLLGTTYGGDGEESFKVPDMRPIEPDSMTYGICVAGIFPTPAE